jgi:hypothetical protein
MAADHLVAALITRDDRDYTLTCGGETFTAHSFLLSARSTFFEAALSGAFKEKKSMEVKEMKPKVLAEVIGFIYGADISEGFTKDIGNCLGLLDAGERFQMDDLKYEASKLIAEELKEDNYFKIGLMAEKYEAAELVEATSRFIMFKAKKVNWRRVKQEASSVAAHCLKMSRGVDSNQNGLFAPTMMVRRQDGKGGAVTDVIDEMKLRQVKKYMG